MADAACAVPAIPGGSGSLLAHGVTSLDPGTGTFKSLSSLDADHYTLAQFIPTYDDDGNRLYTGAARPDAVGVYTFVSLSDAFYLSASPGVTPATISFFLDISGTLQAMAQLNGATSFASNFINFCTAAAGICGTSAAQTDAFFGGSYMNLDGDGASGFTQNSTAPAGATPPTWTFDGAYSPGSVNGRLTLDGIPISSGAPYDFNFVFGTEVDIYHPTAMRGNIPEGCDPALDDTCIAVDPVEINGLTIADFYHTLIFAGYKVLDTNGNDITDSVQLTFRSGLTIPGGPMTATPEPGTFALVGAGLAFLGWRTRRRSGARRSES